MARAQLLICAVLASLAGSALAQNSQPKKGDEPVLKGPSVKETGVPGENRPFSGGKGRKDRMGGEIPHPLFMRALDSLRQQDADEAIRLTSDQDAKIKSIDGEFMAARRKFVQENGQELRELAPQLSPEDRRKLAEFVGREGLRQEGQKGKGTGPKPDEMTPDAETSKAARARVLELVESAPKPADSHAKMFAVLTAEQKAAFQKRLEAARASMQGPAQKKSDGGDKQQIPEELRERLKNMSPEQRKEAIQEWREKRQGQGEDGARKPRDGEKSRQPEKTRKPDKK
jgi:hypothetical protein